MGKRKYDLLLDQLKTIQRWIVEQVWLLCPFKASEAISLILYVVFHILSSTITKRCCPYKCINNLLVGVHYLMEILFFFSTS